MAEEQSIEQIVSQVQNRFKGLRDKAALADASRKLGDISTAVAGLPGEIDKLRERGYAFAGYLAARSESLRAQWDEVRGRVEAQVRDETVQLKAAVGKIDPLMTRLGMVGGKAEAVRQLATQVETQFSALEDEIEHAEERIQGMYGTLERDVNEIRQKLSKFNWYMDMVGEAGFELGATEAVYLVTKGEWVKTGKGKDDPDGLFYLTDQRLIFERKEKEGGFLGFGAKKVQGIEWEVPVGNISEITAEKKGLFGGKDMVTFQFSSGGPGSPTTIEVKGGINANWYAQQVERVKAGDVDEERAVQVDPEVMERVRNAPAACPSCGAPFTTPITHGMTQLVCEYCGEIVRL